MTTFILLLAWLDVFLIALVSPHIAGKIQKKTNQGAGWLKRVSDWLWDPLTWWAKRSVEFTRKAIDAAAGLGKKTHKKL